MAFYKCHLKHIVVKQSFQYFSSVPVLHYVQVVIFLKIEHFECISYTTLFESG